MWYICCLSCIVMKLQLLMKSCSSSAELPTRFPCSSNLSNLPGLPNIYIYISLSIHKLIPLPSTPQPNVFPIKQPCVGCSSRAGVWIFGKQSQCLIPFGLCWGHSSFQSALTSLSTPAVGKVLPSLLEAMFYITGTALMRDFFLCCVFVSLKVNLFGIWSRKCII